MKLYSYWRSSSAWRVRIALAHKGLGHEIAPVHLLRGGGEQHSDGYRALSPLAQVPALVLGDGTVLSQSMAIIEYLEEIRPEPPLLPGDALARARARELAEIVGSGTQPLQNLSVLKRLADEGGDKKAWARHWIRRGLAALEARHTGTRFVAGDEVTVADLFLVPQLYNARRFGVDAEEFPALARVEAACAELPAFRDTRPETQPDAEPGA